MALLKAHKMVAAKEEYAELQDLRNQLESTEQEEQRNILLAELYMKIGNFVKADQLISDLFKKNPSNPKVLAFKGSLVANQAMQGQKGFRIHVLLKKAFIYLDKAIDLASTDEELFHGYLTRGKVSKKLQENFGHKNQRSAEDLMNAAEMAKKDPSLGHPGVILAEAAESLELSGLKNKARELLFKVLSMNDLPSRVLCKILERGIITE